MKLFFVVLVVFNCTWLHGQQSVEMGRYDGRFCSGTGDVDFLRLIDESFAFFHPNPVVPNLTMVYKPEWDTFCEGAGWDGWWSQNPYGFSYAAAPFLQEPWFSVLQRSWDIFWDNQGDGKRKANRGVLLDIVGPDGCLGDGSAPGHMGYRQGDGNVKIHDWFYEATAAVLVMQAEILLVSRNLKSIEFYLPRMERSCNFIEKTRDPKNNLFLVGPACNLLGPSYGGVRQPDGSFGKGYLSGLTITYLAALDRMVEIFRLTGDKEKIAEYEHRQKITRKSLGLLLTPAGYFVKSIEPGGIKHGVLGQKQYGYLEGVANADAVALRVADDQTAKNIYKQIASYPEIRPFDFLLTNAPGLDDTYVSWGNSAGSGLKGFWTFGQWVNGGAWGTVEGRAILMYYRMGKFEDIRRSATRAMKWAKDFRMDAPWAQQGENSHNPWSDSGKFRVGGVAVMIDNFAIPAATIRGLFDFDYRSDRLILRPRIPGSITSYIQKQPVRFGEKKLFLSCRNGGPRIKSVSINGKTLKVRSTDGLSLLYKDLPAEANIEIVTEGGWPVMSSTADYPKAPSILSWKSAGISDTHLLPESLKQPYAILSTMKAQLNNYPGAEYDEAFVSNALKSIEACQAHTGMDPGPGYFRPITSERREGINKFYENTALSMYNGFVSRMTKFDEKGDEQQKRIARLFAEVVRGNSR